MDDIFVYLVDMPLKTKEAVIPCNDGYTVYINNMLCEEERYKAYIHALRHIDNDDFDKTDVQEIEYRAHLAN